ncbi:hypothetical protein Q8F55_009273 [Vanrija albida]|uniref:Uncharacterized protein n=1 Tax=Vanrija albida TaxID=181172 RepID=A0ABR3PT72_9TREE
MKLRIPLLLATLAVARAARYHYLFAGCVDPAALPEGHDYASAANLTLIECDAYLAAAPDAETYPYSVFVPPQADAQSQCFARKSMKATVDWGDGADCAAHQARIGFSAAFSGFRAAPKSKGKTAVVNADDTYCPDGGVPCRLSAEDGYGYECVDTASALANCGGCAFAARQRRRAWRAAPDGVSRLERVRWGGHVGGAVAGWHGGPSRHGTLNRGAARRCVPGGGGQHGHVYGAVSPG